MDAILKQRKLSVMNKGAKLPPKTERVNPCVQKKDQSSR